MLLICDVFMQVYADRIVQIPHSTLGNVFACALRASVDVFDVLIRVFRYESLCFCVHMLRKMLDELRKGSENCVIMYACMGRILRAVLVNIGHMKRKICRSNE